MGLGAGVLLGGSSGTLRAVEPAPADSGPYSGFPRQDLKLVQEVVGAAHANEARVRELIELLECHVGRCTTFAHRRTSRWSRISTAQART